MLLQMFEQAVVNGPVEGQETTYYLEIALVVITAFLFGFVFRLFLNGKLKKNLETLSEENMKLKAEINSLAQQPQDSPAKNDQELERLRSELDKVKAESRLLIKARESAEKKVKELEAKQKDLATTSKVQDPIDDDLTRIEGIGPKLAFVLSEKGIKSFKDLASTTIPNLNGLLEEAGPAFKIHQPDSWPKQAALANEGKWEELAELQEQLLKGE